MKFGKLFSIFALAGSLSGCFSTTVMKDVELTAKELQKGPDTLPVRNVTGFSDGLRCMDDMFLKFGIGRGDYVLMIEELKDKTKKVNAGTRQMMLTAISDMTRRSGALRVNTYGADSGNLISFLSENGNKGVYANVPAFDIIGSISQYDDSVYKKQADASAELAGTVSGSTVGGGGGKSASSSVTFMTVDLSVITAHNLALLPGVTTRNSVSLFNRGSASSYDAGISKTGISFSFSSDTKDAVGQSLRGLIELSTIELVGKLVKLPYWNCLGMDPNHPDIQNEISDWFFQLSNTKILHRTLKLQLALRGLYKGKIDESIDDEYIRGILILKEALGLPKTPSIDANFYSAFLNNVPVGTDASKLAYTKQRQAEKESVAKAKNSKSKKNSVAKAVKPKKPEPSPEPTKVAAKPEQKTEQTAAAKPSMQLNLKSDVDLASAKLGDTFNLSISANQDGHLACYFQRGEAMVKVFPNRFADGSLLKATKQFQLPNSDVFSFVVDKSAEQIHCFLTPAQVEPALLAKHMPEQLNGPDFAPIQGLGFADVKAAYGRALGNQYAYNSVQFVGN